MSGTRRLPGGEPRKASQRNSRRAGPPATKITPVWRVSMRSKGDIDIGAIAKEFGGGGHKNAAGCTVVGGIDALQKMFVEKIEGAIDVHYGRMAELQK